MFSQLLTSIPGSGVPTAISATPLFVSKATFIGYKDLNGTPNSAIVKLGTVITASQQPYPVQVGGEVVIQAADQCEFNLADWFFTTASALDGLVVIYH